ncbi:protein LIFEGUARD 4-like [Canna indica]|uniref:Protein LIFEGUARD 4-like n=1 Tax=Canna indica TaxID=4628 RepID=A0AAQ3Q8B2_9LILI|nr:protein LIFEGUARD 4-like [Canna indica]
MSLSRDENRSGQLIPFDSIGEDVEQQGVLESRGLGVRHAAALPHDAREPRSPVGLHQEGVRHHHCPIIAHGGRRRDRRHRPSYIRVLRLVRRRNGALCPLYYYHKRHPVNLLLLGLFTLSLSFAIGMTCAFTSGKVILEAAILTAVVVVSLTLYTFWAARRGYDFNFLGPFLFAAIMILLVFSFIQIFFPMGKISVMIYGGLAALVFAGYIIYDTDNLIKRYTYDDYIWAAVALYLDIINLFLNLLTLLRAADS